MSGDSQLAAPGPDTSVSFPDVDAGPQNILSAHVVVICSNESKGRGMTAWQLRHTAAHAFRYF